MLTAWLLRGKKESLGDLVEVGRRRTGQVFDSLYGRGRGGKWGVG